MTHSRSLRLYAGVGPVLWHYDVDVAAATLTRRGSVTLPANVQYVWPHANRRFLYATSSDGSAGAGGVAGKTHHLSAIAVDPATGALLLHGKPAALPSRPIHSATDIPSTHALVAFNHPAAVRVYRINADFSVGTEVLQPHPIEAGLFPHQVLAAPDNKSVILIARGHDATADRAEEPGALMEFDYADGILSNQRKIAPQGGYGFGPRHLDFHPTQPFVYVSLERQNQLALFLRAADGLDPLPAARVDTLAEPDNRRSHQLVGTVHVHPNGRFAYIANRASDTVEQDGRRVFRGGENTLAVFALDPTDGQPRLIQQVDTHGIHPRTFHIDPSGRLLVVAHIMGLHLPEGPFLPARLSLFQIGDDGRLTFARAYDVDTDGRFLWWMGMVAA